MAPRQRKLIAIAIMVPGLIIYCFAAILLADLVPSFWLAKLIYFVAAGIAWAFPLKRLMVWAAGGD